MALMGSCASSRLASNTPLSLCPRIFPTMRILSISLLFPNHRNAKSSSFKIEGSGHVQFIRGPNGRDCQDHCYLKPRCSLFQIMVFVEAPKKKVKKINVSVTEVVYRGLAASDVQKAVEKEFEMALQDRVMEEMKDKKNVVEACVYDMRNKLYDKYQEFVTESDKEQLISKLQEVEEWLYEDGEGETKGVYIAKLEELKKQGDPIEERFKEHTESGTVIEQLVYCINSYRETALSSDAKFDHIDLAEKQKVLHVYYDHRQRSLARLQSALNPEGEDL